MTVLQGCRRRFIATFGIGVLTLVSATFANESSPPNIVFILVDDLGYTDLGCYGSSFYDTPHIDRLAKQGMRFTNAYAACPVCSPTRASIMVGKYPQRMRITDYISPNGGNQPEKWKRKTPYLPAPYVDRLAHDEHTLAEHLKSAGYATFFAGKWHLGPEGFWPEDQGFDVNCGGIDRGGPYGGKKYFSPYGNPRLKDGPDGENLPARLGEETAAFITQNREQPFLAYLSFYSVHTPLMCREDLKAKYQKKRTDLGELTEEQTWGKEGRRKVRLVQNHAVYAGMVEAMDAAVGRVLKALDDEGLAENTVVFFTSDNGGLSTSEGHPTSNLPLRAGKGWLYEGGIREPLLVRWPGKVEAGSVCDTPVSSPDFFPTIAEITHVSLPDDGPYDGISLVGVLTGTGSLPPNRPLYWHYPHYGNQGGRPGSAIRSGPWKLIEFFGDDAVELYQLGKDLSETTNLASSEKDQAETLRKKLSDWRDSLDVLYPQENPAAKKGR